MYNQVKKSLIFRKFSPIVLIKQLTLCFIFALAAVLVQGLQHVEAGEFDDYFVLEASGEVKGYQFMQAVPQRLDDPGYGIATGGPPISNPTALAIVRDLYYGDQRLCVASDTGLHVFTENGSGLFSFYSTFSGEFNPVDPVDLVVGLEVVAPQIVNNMVDFKPITGPYLTIPFTEDYPPCTCGCPDTSVAFFGFGAELRNKSCTSLTNLTVKVRTLTNENLLLLARGGEAYPEDYAGTETGGEGVLWTLPLPPSGSYSDGTLGPDEYTIVVFAICLEERVPFRFYVDLLGEMQ